jgi:hypothetical protein
LWSPICFFSLFFENCGAKLFAQISFNARWIKNCIVASLVTVLCCTQVSIAKLYSPEEQDLQHKQRTHMLSVINTAMLWQQHHSSFFQNFKPAPCGGQGALLANLYVPVRVQWCAVGVQHDTGDAILDHKTLHAQKCTYKAHSNPDLLTKTARSALGCLWSFLW